MVSDAYRSVKNWFLSPKIFVVKQNEILGGGFQHAEHGWFNISLVGKLFTLLCP